jgi:hypothetical protein
MNFKWTVNKVQIAEDNLIVKVELTVTAIDGDNSASTSYVRDLTRSDLFIPFDQLTEQQVLDWCFEPIVSNWVDDKNVEQTSIRFIKNEGEVQIIKQLECQLAHKSFEPALPWL